MEIIKTDARGSRRQIHVEINPKPPYHEPYDGDEGYEKKFWIF
jgi:hypothetical protein